MQCTETSVNPVCPECGFENDLGSELDEASCTKCGALLEEHEVVVSYNDNCPLCGVSYEAGKPYVFVVDEARVNQWICRECQRTPRGVFYIEFEQGLEKPKAAPPCCLCGVPSKLIALTHSNDDGEFLCEACALSEAGKKMISEHYETE